MNMQEFAALKVGDKIENACFGPSRGTVTETTDRGVRLAWDSAPGITYLYTVNSTAWMHWSKPESNVSPELDKAISDELADKPANIATC